MSFSQFVVRNTLRNKHLYLAYFLSAVISVSVFFSFMALANHPAVLESLRGSGSSSVQMAAWIIYIFAFLFVFYSMDIFIQSRKKEFGTLMIQGLSPKQLKRMVFIENIVLGFFATIFGCIIGIGFTQIMIAFGNHFLNLDYVYYLPVMTIGITVIVFSLLFLIISFFIRFKLPKYSLQELLNAGKIGKGTIKFSVVKSLMGIALIGLGYYLALGAPSDMVVIFIGPIAIMEIIGAALLFHQASIMFIACLKRIRSIFWKKTNLAVLSDLSFRMKDNARAFFLVSVIASVAFTAIGGMIGFKEMLLEPKARLPYEFLIKGPNDQVAASVDNLDQELQNRKIKSTSGHAQLYTNKDKSLWLLTEQDYNDLAQAANKPTVKTNGAATLIVPDIYEFKKIALEAERKVAINDQSLKVTQNIDSTLLNAVELTYVVPNNTDLSGMEEISYNIWMTPHTNKKTLKKLGEELAMKDGNIQSNQAGLAMLESIFSPIVFIGVFIGTIFFISAGSFIYFRLYSDLNTDIEKFRLIRKIGLTKKEMKKMISQQLALLFFVPIGLSLMNGFVGLSVMYHMYGRELQTTGWIVLGLFALLQIIYYLISRHFYFKKVYHATTS